MNFYTVGKATQGIAQFIIHHGKEAMEKGVVIAHDPRHFSREFCEMTAGILAANGIKVYTFPSLRPTPELAFLIRKIGTVAGINLEEYIPAIILIESPFFYKHLLLPDKYRRMP